jgi:protein-tyrosine phosphatase
MVCTGNICRSPMAEALLASRMRQRGADPFVTSAGIAAMVGSPADPIAVELMRERGLSLETHRAHQLTPELVRAADLVLVMEHNQVRPVEELFPAARGRVQRLGRITGFDVPDPYRRGRPAFVEALALIERGVDDVERTFWSERR